MTFLTIQVTNIDLFGEDKRLKYSFIGRQLQFWPNVQYNLTFKSDSGLVDCLRLLWGYMGIVLSRSVEGRTLIGFGRRLYQSNV